MTNQNRKQDYAEINHIKYGLFSINEWKYQLNEIIQNEISDLDLRKNKEQLKPLVEAQLHKLIDSVQDHIQKKNKTTFKGRVKQAFINTFVDVKDIKAGVPRYADEVIKIMNRPKSKRNIKELMLDKVEDYFDKTYEQQDRSAIGAIILKLNVTDIDVARVKLDEEIKTTHELVSLHSWILLGLVGLLFLLSALDKNPIPSLHYIILVVALFVLLICGVTIPMIDLEAKISEMSFVLMSHPVKFLNQVLYFQSKSVIDVFWLMITHPKIQMQIVGLLMVLFSIVFPAFKLVSSLLFYYDSWGFRKNKIIHFFVHKSGKWSMTDVMIIAIFMAYIGFSGVISSQLGKLHAADQEIVLLTTNGTSLQPGFYLFMGYAVFALFLSEFLTRKVGDV
ncbi:MAG: paraquat-inducible protein A [Bdellovibrionota bacterium]